tara:strand:- start:29 stop:463 length:435 start_codon:yes stop_codon:yes gene_type:complete
MIQSTPGDVEDYLAAYGWNFRRHGRGVWISGWSSDERSFPLRVTWSESFIDLMVQPLYKLEFDWEAYPEVATWLLELGHQYSMIKITIDEIGDLVMSLSLVNHNLDAISFSTSLGIIGHYADRVYGEIADALDQLSSDFEIPII